MPEPSVEPEIPEDQPTQEPEDGGRPKRRRRLPMRLKQFTVSSQAALVKQRRVRFKEPTPSMIGSQAPAVVSPTRNPSPQPSPDDNTADEPLEQTYWITEPNEFGLFSVYEDQLPSCNPDEEISAETIADAPTFASNLPERSPLSVFGADVVNTTTPSDDQSKSDLETSQSDNDTLAIALFLNKSVFLLMNWFYKGPRLTLNHLTHLAKDVILNPDFHKSDLKGFNAKRENERMKEFLAPRSEPSRSDDPSGCPPGDGWHCESVTIPVPCSKHKFPSEDAAPKFTVRNVWVRDLKEVIRAEYESQSSSQHHLRAHKDFVEFQPDDVQRVYGETYTSDRML